MASVKLRDATTIIGVDTVRERLAVARKPDADDLVDIKAGDPVVQVMALTQRRGVDLPSGAFD